MNDQKKRFIVFSLIVICGFSGAFLFLNKKSISPEPSLKKEETKKDSIVTISLLSEFFDLENNSDAYISTEKAFSGKKSIKLTPTIEYGFGVTHPLKDFPSYQNLKFVVVNFKCLTKKPDTSACYVFAINDKNGKNIFWQGVTIKSEKNDEWADDTIKFDIKSESLNPDYTLNFYPWNKAKKVIFIDDIAFNFMGTTTFKTNNSTTSPNTNLFFDFETTTGLSGTETIKQTTAHSGKFACDLTGGKEYGPSVSRKIKDISDVPIKKISLSVWVYPLTDNSNTVLTASVANQKNETVFWDGKSSENKNFPKNKWSKINAAFFIPPEKISLDDILNVNIWNKGKTDVIVDDLEIVYGDSPERKGNSSTIDVNSIYEKHFVPQRNKPPFKTIYFQKQEISNSNSTSIVPEKNTVTGDFSPNDNFLVGNFTDDKSNLDDVICLKNGPDGISSEGLFSYSPTKKQFEKIWENTSSTDSIWNNGNNIYSQDFNKDGRSDLLFVNKKNQSWTLCDFDGKKWVILSKGKDPKKEWGALTKNGIPSVSNAKDILKPSDILYSGNYFDNKTELLKLNTDWRFDLKIIGQDKEGYTIIGNVDFKGYPKDFNPKYYEFVKIVSGKFINANQSSLIVIMRNCADDNFDGVHCKEYENLSALPNSTQLYSIESN